MSDSVQKFYLDQESFGEQEIKTEETKGHSTRLKANTLPITNELVFDESCNIMAIKETEGKKDYSEINLEVLDLMADRFSANKHKYPVGNMKRPIDIKHLEWALFRHIKKMIQPKIIRLYHSNN